ncbi:MAG: hypothetical protein Q9163_001382 [Psora crenata]
MPKLSAPKSRASNVSSAANPAASSTASTVTRSSILNSSFSPPRYRLSLFASVIQGLDSQHLRIHDTNTGRLRCEHAIGSKASITCLDWGFYGRGQPNGRQQVGRKKRRRVEQLNGDTENGHPKDIALALGTSDSEIHLYSPAQAKAIGLLTGGHTKGIRSFKFSEDGVPSDGWSVGGDARLVQWNLESFQLIRAITLPTGPANTIQPLGTSVIYASHLAYILDPESQTSPPHYNASTNPVRTIVSPPLNPSQGTVFLTAAEADHFMNVFHHQSPTSIGSLRTETEVLHVDLYANPRRPDRLPVSHGLTDRLMRPEEALAVVNKDGVLELFPEPFSFGGSDSWKSLESTKERMKGRSRRSAAQVRIIRPDKTSAQVPLINVAFQDSHIILAWAEAGIDVVFDTLPWRDEGTGALLLTGNMSIAKGKKGGLGAVMINGVKDMGKAHVDESHTVVATTMGGGDDVSMEDQHPEIINISSGQEESESEQEDVGLVQSTNATTVEDANDSPKGMDVDMKNGEVLKAEDDEQEEPSFGDVLRARAAEAVDVSASFVDPKAQSLVPTTDEALQQLPSGMSLGTVLTQSLRTNDKDLLETCFHVKDLRTIRATIERLDSSFAITLLQRLADRLHSRPGRAGSLMVWIQWTLIAHGGYLAGQPEVMKKLASLHRVVKDRANSLQSLLSLKGKLDMLEAQMNLRKSRQKRLKVDDEEDDDSVVYVEGQEESDSEQGEEGAGESDGDADAAPGSARAETGEVPDVDDAHANSDHWADSGLDMPMANGKVAESEDEGSESDDEGISDEQTSSAGEESGEEISDQSIDHDDVDTESSDADTSPPPKRRAKPSTSDGHRQ